MPDIGESMTKGVFQVWIEIELDNLSEYVAIFEDSLTDELEEFTSRTEKQASKLTKEQQNEFYELFYIDKRWQLSEVFPNTLRSSLFVTCYSLLEHELVGLCEYLQREHNYSIKVTDLRGKGIFGAQTYLKKVVGIDFPDQTSSWTDIVVYNRIRNFIVHNNGQLDDSNQAKKLESFINAKPSISLDQLKYIQFSKDFCPEVIGTLESFFDELFKILPYKL